MRLGLLERRPLIALQVEVTSRCSRRCTVCPRTALASVWRDGDLSDATWERLRPDLSLARHVHLQGWGEPLLHPRLPEMVEAVKSAGGTVGVTTNGDLLADAVDWITAKGVDLVTVSVAGDEATHAALRCGSRLERTWAAVRRLVAHRARRNRPKVQVSYLLTRQNTEHVAGSVQSAAAAGADEFFIVHLDCTPSRALLESAAFDVTGLASEAAEAIEAACRMARFCGIAFRTPALTRQELLVCALNPSRFAFVTWDGRVGPCVNLLLPVEGPMPRWDENGPTRVDPVAFGDLADGSLRQILGGEHYRCFAARFEARLGAEVRFLDGLRSRWGAQALEHLDEADRRRSDDLAENPFPQACTACHKAVGW